MILEHTIHRFSIYEDVHGTLRGRLDLNCSKNPDERWLVSFLPDADDFETGIVYFKCPQCMGQVPYMVNTTEGVGETWRSGYGTDGVEYRWYEDDDEEAGGE